MSPRVYKKPPLSGRPVRMDPGESSAKRSASALPAEDPQRQETAMRDRVARELEAAAAREAQARAQDWEAEKAAWFAAQEKPLLDLALQIAAQVCRVEVKDRSASAAAWAREGLARLAGPCVVAVHPQDAKAVGALEEVRRPQVSVEVRPGLEPGDVLIDTPAGRFDARVNTRLEEAARTVEEASAEDPDAR